MKYNSRRFVCLLPIRCIAFLIIFVICALLTNSSVENISNWWSIIASCVNIATIFLLVLVARKSGGNFKVLVNYEKGKTKPSQVVLISLLIVALGMAGMYLAGLICYGKFPYAAPMMVGHAIIDVATVAQIAMTSLIPGVYDMMCSM